MNIEGIRFSETPEEAVRRRVNTTKTMSGLMQLTEADYDILLEIENKAIEQLRGKLSLG